MPKGRRYIKMYHPTASDIGFGGEAVEKDGDAFLVPEEHAGHAEKVFGFKTAKVAEVLEVPPEILSASELARAAAERDQLEAKVKELEGKVLAHEQARGRK